MIVSRYVAQGMKRDEALRICGLSKHQYYHRGKGGKRGRRASRSTLQQVQDEVVSCSNQEVVAHIRTILSNPLADYGYRRMSAELALLGFYINHKKVYRLMKQAGLLQPKQERLSKQYVKYRIVLPEGPLRLLEMDIKMVWLEGQRRYAYVLTILDVFTRVVLDWQVGLQMRQGEVQQAWQRVIARYLQPYGALAWETHIEIRSDNGPQFCAKALCEFLRQNYFEQVFTHPYTPQENGHIESFHAILSRALEGQYFAAVLNLNHSLEIFYDFYNYDRIHGSTARLPPYTFWQQWLNGNIERQVIDLKARKVRFQLKIPRQQIQKCRPAGNGSHREVWSLHLMGLDAPENAQQTPSDGPVLIG